MAVGELLAGDTSRGAVNEGAVVVNDLGNDGELAGRGTVVDEDDTADLDKALESGGLLLRLRMLAPLPRNNRGLVGTEHGSSRSLVGRGCRCRWVEIDSSDPSFALVDTRSGQRLPARCCRDIGSRNQRSRSRASTALPRQGLETLRRWSFPPRCQVDIFAQNFNPAVLSALPSP